MVTIDIKNNNSKRVLCITFSAFKTVGSHAPLCLFSRRINQCILW